MLIFVIAAAYRFRRLLALPPSSFRATFRSNNNREAAERAKKEEVRAKKLEEFREEFRQQKREKLEAMERAEARMASEREARIKEREKKAMEKLRREAMERQRRESAEDGDDCKKPPAIVRSSAKPSSLRDWVDVGHGAEAKTDEREVYEGRDGWMLKEQVSGGG